MRARRVVITGIGPVTPVGTGRRPFWRALVDGQSGIRPITRFDTNDFPTRVAGEIPQFDVSRFMDRRDARRFPLFAQYAVAAARLSLEDGGLSVHPTNRIAACFASSIGGFSELVVDDLPGYNLRGVSGLSPFASTNFSPHVGTSAVCQCLGLQGPKATIASGCTAGSDVVEWGRAVIESGAADCAVVGCSDAPLYPFTFGVLLASRVYSTSAPVPRPFDHRHDGSAVSEGAGAVLLESLEHALHRKAPIYAEVLGHGSSGEVGELFRPSTGNGAEQAMRAALRSAGLAPTDLDCVFPLAIGLPSTDLSDSRAIQTVLGEHAYRVPTPSVASMLGHMISGGSMMQAIALALALHSQQVPPTIHFEKPAPECDLDCVPNRSRFSRLRAGITCSRSLARTYASLVLGRPSEATDSAA